MWPGVTDLWERKMAGETFSDSTPPSRTVMGWELVPGDLDSHETGGSTDAPCGEVGT